MKAVGVPVIKLSGTHGTFLEIQNVSEKERKITGEYHCHKLVHWARECQKKKYDMESQASTPAPPPNNASAPVLDNFQGIALAELQMTRFPIQYLASSFSNTNA